MLCGRTNEIFEKLVIQLNNHWTPGIQEHIVVIK